MFGLLDCNMPNFIRFLVKGPLTHSVNSTEKTPRNAAPKDVSKDVALLLVIFELEGIWRAFLSENDYPIKAPPGHVSLI